MAEQVALGEDFGDDGSLVGIKAGRCEQCGGVAIRVAAEWRAGIER